MAKPKTETGPPSAAGPRPPLIRRLLGLVLAAGFMFTVGVFVGRGTAPVGFDIPDLQARLKSLRDAAYREAVERFKIETDSPDERRPLKYREVLIQPTDSAGGEAPPPAAKTAKPAPTKTPAPQTGADPAEYILQVASMKDGDAALAMADELRKKGYPAYRESIEIADKGLWYRVRVGGYPDREAAERAQAKMGPVARDSMVVRKP